MRHLIIALHEIRAELIPAPKAGSHGSLYAKPFKTGVLQT